MSPVMAHREVFRFRLFIAGETLNSVRAIANLTAICRTHLADRHEIEVVDVLRHPEEAMAAGILMTPTLLKFAPGSRQKIVGTLSDAASVLDALGLEAISA